MSNDPASGGPHPVRMSRRLRLGWRHAALFAGAVLGGSVAGAGGLAYAAMNGMGWHGGHRLEMIQRRVHDALDSVGATTVQEDKVHDIIANGFNAMADTHGDRMAARKQMIDLLRAPTIDRAAVEKLRADQVVRYDARSKTMVGVILDSADQLSPSQRATLADRLDAMMARGHGRWHDDSDGRDDGARSGMHREPDGEGPDGDHGPDGRPMPDRNPG